MEAGVCLLLQLNLLYPDWCPHLTTNSSSPVLHKVGLIASYRERYFTFLVFYLFCKAVLCSQVSSLSLLQMLFDFQKQVLILHFSSAPRMGKVPHRFSFKTRDRICDTYVALARTRWRFSIIAFSHSQWGQASRYGSYRHQAHSLLRKTEN